MTTSTKLYQRLSPNGAVLEGPKALPPNWGNIPMFSQLTDEELKTYGWFPVDAEPKKKSDVADFLSNWKSFMRSFDEKDLSDVVVDLELTAFSQLCYLRICQSEKYIRNHLPKVLAEIESLLVGKDLSEYQALKTYYLFDL